MLHKRGWWSRTFRRTSSQSTEHSLRRQRSSSHVMGHLAHPKRDSLRDQDLQGLVRLCGKSFLYLPPEYAPGSLVLPTCFRATAQYLVQHGQSAGCFVFLSCPLIDTQQPPKPGASSVFRVLSESSTSFMNSTARSSPPISRALSEAQTFLLTSMPVHTMLRRVSKSSFQVYQVVYLVHSPYLMQ